MEETAAAAEEQAPQIEVAPAVEAAAMEAAPLPQVTSPDEWRRRAKARWLITLPSGATVKARRPDFGRLVADKVIDAQQLVEMPTGGTAASGYDKLLPLAKATVPYIVVEPVVVGVGNEQAPGDALTVDEIADTDLVTLFLWAGGWTTIAAIEVAE